MRFVGNLLWFIFGGGLLGGLAWWLAGILCFCTIIGIPFGFACFRIAAFAFFPFGKELVPAEYVGGKAVFGSTLGNIIWCIFLGLWLAIGGILLGIGLCLTIIGIPFGLANFKIAQAAFAPLGKRVVSSEMAAAARARHAQAALDKKLGTQTQPNQ